MVNTHRASCIASRRAVPLLALVAPKAPNESADLALVGFTVCGQHGQTSLDSPGRWVSAREAARVHHDSQENGNPYKQPTFHHGRLQVSTTSGLPGWPTLPMTFECHPDSDLVST
jgi:hypothetical protein